MTTESNHFSTDHHPINLSILVTRHIITTTRGHTSQVLQQPPVEPARAGVDGGRAGRRDHLQRLVPESPEGAVRHAQQVLADLVGRALRLRDLGVLESHHRDVQSGRVPDEYYVATCKNTDSKFLDR